MLPFHVCTKCTSKAFRLLLSIERFWVIFTEKKSLSSFFQCFKDKARKANVSWYLLLHFHCFHSHLIYNHIFLYWKTLFISRCVARNPSGEDAATLFLNVVSRASSQDPSSKPNVKIHPEVIVADIGSPAAFNCHIPNQQPFQGMEDNYYQVSFMTSCGAIFSLHIFHFIRCQPA